MAVRVSTSAGDLQASREVVSPLPLPYLTPVSSLPAGPLKDVLGADCQLRPGHTPLNNSAPGPHKILGDKKWSDSTLRILSQNPVPIPGILDLKLLAAFPRR